jgi:lactoylglutathione lyase
MRRMSQLFIAILLAGFLQAQDSVSFKFSVNHLALSVTEVNRSAGFYSKVFGLPEITNRSKIEGIRWFVLGDGRELHLISVIKEKVTTNKALHLGLSTASFDVFVKRLDQFKIPYSDWPGKPNTVNIRADGIKQIFFQDPDGYWLEVNSLEQ